jgi:hypothetical protein
VLPFEERVEVETEGQFDRFAGGPRGRDDDHAAAGMRCVPVGVGIRGEVMVTRRMHAESYLRFDALRTASYADAA